MTTFKELAAEINKLGGELGVTQKTFYTPTGYASYTTEIVVFRSNFKVVHRDTYLAHETEQQIVDDLIQQEILKKL